MLATASKLENDLLGEGTLVDENLRRSLAEIISTLGGARWKLEVSDDGVVRQDSDDPVTAKQ